MIGRAGLTDRLANAIGTRLDGSPLAVMLDIDGTLAPIAPRPEVARIPQTTRETLRRIVELRDTIVALVTGRSVEDALRMSIDGAWIIGNHGLELRSPEGELTANPEAMLYEDAVASAARDLAPLERDFSGAIVENKRWGLSVHYRLVDPGAIPAIGERVGAIAGATGLHISEGKMILELRPPIRVDKGTATVAFIERVGASVPDASALYAGDDRTDEDAFRALRQRGTRAVTVRVHAGGDGTATEAELAVPSPDDVRRLLEWLADRRARVAR